MPYERICSKCNETQILKGEPRSPRCHACRMIHDNPKLGTGRSDVGNTCGYRMIYVNKKRVYEHRYVMEMSLGRRLRRNEHIHHKDGNRINNKLDNLELISPSDHARVHIANRAKEMSALAHKKRAQIKEVANSSV